VFIELSRLDYLGCSFVTDMQYGSNFSEFEAVGSASCPFVWNNAYWQLRSTILVPVESPYATCY